MISLKNNKITRDYDIEALYKDKKRLDENIENTISYKLEDEYKSLLNVQTLLIEDFTMSISIVNEMLNKIKIELEDRSEKEYERLQKEIER